MKNFALNVLHINPNPLNTKLEKNMKLSNIDLNDVTRALEHWY